MIDDVKISELPNTDIASINDRIPIVQSGVTKGILFEKYQDQLLNVPDYVKTWDALNNIPTLSSGVGILDTIYIVNEDGSTNLDGVTSWNKGDFAYFDGSVWRKLNNVPVDVKTWDANTNVPTLLSSVGETGTIYIVNKSGTTNLNGVNYWTEGDIAYFNGTVWTKLNNVPSHLMTWNADSNIPTLFSGGVELGTMYIVNYPGNTVLDGINFWNLGDIAFNDGSSWIKIKNTSDIENVFFLDPINGNDATANGTIEYPFKTMQIANASVFSASQSNPYVIYIMPGIINEPLIEKKPYVSYVGIAKGAVTFTSAGGFVLSSQGASLAHKTEISNIILDGCDLNFNGLLYPTASLNILLNNIETTNSKISITGKIANQYLLQNIKFYSQTVGHETSIDGCTTTLYDGEIYSLQSKATVTAASALLNLFGGKIDQLEITSNSTNTCNAYNCSVITSLSIQGVSTLNIDSDSIPSSGLTVIGGSPTVNYKTMADGVVAGFIPSNYTPSNTRVKAHLQAIDAKLPTLADTTIYNSDSTLLSNRTVSMGGFSLTVAQASENIKFRDTSAHPSAILALNSTSRAFLPTRMTSGQRTSVASPVEGLQTHDTDIKAPFVYSNGEWRGVRLYQSGILSYPLIFPCNSFGGNANVAIIASSSAVSKQFGPSGTTDEYVTFTIPLEASATGFNMKFHWCPSSTNVGNVIWQASVKYATPSQVIASNTLLAPTILSRTTGGVTDAIFTETLAVSGFNIRSAPTTIFTIKLSRLGSDLSDTFTGQAQFLFLELDYTLSLSL